MRTYHYSVRIGHGKTTFQQSLSDHCVGRSLSFGKVVAYSPRGLLPHKRICLLYSVFKELSAIQPIKINSSQIDFNRMTSEVAGKGGTCQTSLVCTTSLQFQNSSAYQVMLSELCF